MSGRGGGGRRSRDEWEGREVRREMSAGGEGGYECIGRCY